ncbi:peroxiredoxin family protein [Pseudomonadota bacterium]
MRKKLPLLCLLVAMLSPAASVFADPYAAMKITRLVEPIPAPAFTISNLNGDETSLDDYKGKLVLLNFWATWCFPCRQEMPDMETLWQRYKDQGLVVIGVSNDDKGKTKRVETFVNKINLSFPILLDSESVVSDLYDVSGIPVSYLIGQDGNVLAQVMGVREWASPDSFALVEHLLQQK